MKLANILSPFRESWGRTMQDNSDGLCNSRRGLLCTGLASSIVGALSGGIFFTTLLLIVLKDATTEEYGYFIALNTSIQSLAGATQLIAPFFVEKMRSRRRLIYTLYGIYHAINLLLLPMLTQLPLTVSEKGYIFVTLCGMMSVSTALCGPTLSIWTLHSLPDTCRSDYFVINSSVGGILSTALSFGLAMFMDFHTANNTALFAIILMRCIAIPFVAGEYAARHYTAEPEYNTGMTNISFLNILRAPFSSPKFLIAVSISFFWGIIGGFSGTYYAAYLLDGAKLSYTFYSFCGIPATPISILMLPFWNKLIRRFGWLRVMAVSMALYGLCYGMNGLVTEQSRWMFLVGSIYCSLISGGYSLGSSNLSYMFLPDNLRSSCLAFYSICGSISSAFAAFLARQFYSWSIGYNITVFGLVLENRAYMCLITCVFMIVEAFFVWWVAVKNEKIPKRESAPAAEPVQA